MKREFCEISLIFLGARELVRESLYIGIFTPCPAEERKPARIWVVQPDVAPLAGTPPRSPERVPWWMDGKNPG